MVLCTMSMNSAQNEKLYSFWEENVYFFILFHHCNISIKYRLSLKKVSQHKHNGKKFIAIISVSQRGEHYFEILDVNESVNAERYTQFLTHMEAST